MRLPDIMVVSDNLKVQQAFASTLGERGLAPIIAFTIGEAEAIVSRHAVRLVFCSDELPGGEIERFIRNCSCPPTPVPVVVVSRLDDCRRYLNYLQIGAFDYVLYPLRLEEIEHVMGNVLKDGYSKKMEHSVSAR